MLLYFPEPTIPFAGSDYTSSTTLVLHPGAVAIVGEVVACGRIANGEVLAMRRYEGSLEAIAANGSLLFRDVTRLTGEPEVRDVGALGTHRALGACYVIGRRLDPRVLRASAAADVSIPSPLYVGASTLPNSAGSWLRVLAPDLEGAARTVSRAAGAARLALLGSPPPASRRL